MTMLQPPSYYKPFEADKDALFPSDFFHGFATASAQIEGHIHADDRGASVWDEFCERPGAIIDGTKSEPATGSYKVGLVGCIAERRSCGKKT